MAVCGGGALNNHLMHRLKDLLAPLPVEPTDVLGLPVMQVEACALRGYWPVKPSWGKQGTSNVTGAQGARVLGPFYPLDALCRAWPGQAEKLEPQPQVVVAFGFLITNCAP